MKCGSIDPASRNNTGAFPAFGGEFGLKSGGNLTQRGQNVRFVTHIKKDTAMSVLTLLVSIVVFAVTNVTETTNPVFTENLDQY